MLGLNKDKFPERKVSEGQIKEVDGDEKTSIYDDPALYNEGIRLAPKPRKKILPTSPHFCAVVGTTIVLVVASLIAYALMK